MKFLVLASSAEDNQFRLVWVHGQPTAAEVGELLHDMHHDLYLCLAVRQDNGIDIISIDDQGDDHIHIIGVVSSNCDHGHGSNNSDITEDGHKKWSNH